MKKVYIIPLLLFIIGCSLTSTSHVQSSTYKEPRFQETIKIGMTKEQVREKWGQPDKIINEQRKEYDETWVYSPHWKFKNYLYFKNGILINGSPNPEDLF